MWKKIGAINSHSNQLKSSRSRDENPYEPFSQMSRLRTSESQICFEQNDYFCSNYLSKKKSDSKGSSTEKCSENLSKVHKRPSLRKQRTFEVGQIQDLERKIFGSLNDSSEKDPENALQNANLATESTQHFGSQTSLENDIKKLKHCKSTPQFGKIGSIIEEIPLDKRLSTQKNIRDLREEHQQLKSCLKNSIGHLGAYLERMQSEMTEKLSEHLQEKEAEREKKYQVSKQTLYGAKLLHSHLRNINKEKEAVMDKFKSIRIS